MIGNGADWDGEVVGLPGPAVEAWADAPWDASNTPHTQHLWETAAPQNEPDR